ncbi:hypothetical protein DP116_26605 [Brasilonema bromeliae SPC951]|uniref:Uncharacterized protein n=1 Tax=Brasilonema bromeliae SPC951 TaxID=385972 RepID=A0ABX1PE99_9CYAN|nr:hypothetical protein [Brasilonema bromeliae SPC951]
MFIGDFGIKKCSFYQLSVTSYQLSVSCPVVHCSLFTVHCSLFDKPQINLRPEAISKLKFVRLFSRLELKFRPNNSFSQC